MWPQIIIILINFVGLLLAANTHGKEKTETKNFWSTLIAVIIIQSILIWGGFYKNLF